MKNKNIPTIGIEAFPTINRLQTLVSRNFILYLKLGPASHIDDGEGPVLHISLNCGIIELASDQTLRVEDSVVRVDGDLKNLKLCIVEKLPSPDSIKSLDLDPGRPKKGCPKS
jgi:hypothetical protein